MKVMSMVGDVSAVLRARYYLRSAESLGARVRLWGVPAVKNEGRLLIGDRTRKEALLNAMAPRGALCAGGT